VEREREGRKLLTAPPLSLSHVASPAAFPIGKPVREFSKTLVIYWPLIINQSDRPGKLEQENMSFSLTRGNFHVG